MLAVSLNNHKTLLHLVPLLLLYCLSSPLTLLQVEALLEEGVGNVFETVPENLQNEPFLYNSEGVFQHINASPHQRLRRATLMTSLPMASGDSEERPVNASVAEREENNGNTESTRVVDNHKYYTSQYFAEASPRFLDLASGHAVRTAATHYADFEVSRHDLLSKAYLKADTVKLKFPFHFYGNMIKSVVVTTGGFLGVGPIFHAHTHMVHYVAPLMANFNPSMTSGGSTGGGGYNNTDSNIMNATKDSSSSSGILVGSGRDVFIVQWNELRLNNSANEDGSGKDMTFTFQAVLHRNGTIVFAYKNIPELVSQQPTILENKPHNVTVGLADGLIQSFVFRRNGKIIFHNYIYSYHKVAFPLHNVRSGAAYVLDLQPTCIQQHNCTTCLDGEANSRFTCKWCPKLQLCSDGIDWHRQVWTKYCDPKHSPGAVVAETVEQCYNMLHDGRSGRTAMTKRSSSDRNSSASLIGGIFGFLALIVLVVVAGVFYYAYTRPQSVPGMWLIEHRPSVVFRKAMHKNDRDSDDQLL